MWSCNLCSAKNNYSSPRCWNCGGHKPQVSDFKVASENPEQKPTEKGGEILCKNQGS